MILRTHIKHISTLHNFLNFLLFPLIFIFLFQGVANSALRTAHPGVTALMAVVAAGWDTRNPAMAGAQNTSARVARKPFASAAAPTPPSLQKARAIAVSPKSAQFLHIRRPPPSEHEGLTLWGRKAKHFYQARNLDRVSQLYPTTPPTDEALRTDRIARRDLLKDVPNRGTVIDLGSGKDATLLDSVRRVRPDIENVGIDVQPISNPLRSTQTYQGIVPHSEGANSLRRVYQNRGHVVLDTHGPSAYTHPLHSLIYGISLTKPGEGTYLSLTGAYRVGKVDSSRFGDRSTRTKIKAFLKKHMDADVEFLEQRHLSDTEDKILDNITVVATRPARTTTKRLDLEALFKRADEEIGTPVNERTGEAINPGEIIPNGRYDGVIYRKRTPPTEG